MDTKMKGKSSLIFRWHGFRFKSRPFFDVIYDYKPGSDYGREYEWAFFIGNWIFAKETVHKGDV